MSFHVTLVVLSPEPAISIQHFVWYFFTFFLLYMLQITFRDIKVTSVKITTPQLRDNEINTFWQQANIDLSRGLDFAENKGSVFAQVTHLQHAPFQYNITVRDALFLKVSKNLKKLLYVYCLCCRFRTVATHV